MSLHLSRADRGPIARWFWTIDHVLLALVIVLIGIGLIAVAAASPAAAHRYSGTGYAVGDLHYLKRQIFWVALGLPVMIGASMLSVAQVKRVGLAGAGLCLAALIAVPLFGAEVNGAVRWLQIGPFQFQPSEFLKPLFIITTAVLLAVRFKDARAPAILASLALLSFIAFFLIRQPDLAGNSDAFVSETLQHTEERSLGGAEERFPEVVKIRLRRVVPGAAFRFEHGKGDGHEHEQNDDSGEEGIHCSVLTFNR